MGLCLAGLAYLAAFRAPACYLAVNGAALGLALAGFSLTALIGNYPSILIGYDAAPILGYGLALSLIVVPRETSKAG